MFPVDIFLFFDEKFAFSWERSDFDEESAAECLLYKLFGDDFGFD